MPPRKKSKRRQKSNNSSTATATAAASATAAALWASRRRSRPPTTNRSNNAGIYTALGVLGAAAIGAAIYASSSSKKPSSSNGGGSFPSNGSGSSPSNGSGSSPFNGRGRPSVISRHLSGSLGNVNDSLPPFLTKRTPRPHYRVRPSPDRSRKLLGPPSSPAVGEIIYGGSLGSDSSSNTSGGVVSLVGSPGSQSGGGPSSLIFGDRQGSRSSSSNASVVMLPGGYPVPRTPSLSSDESDIGRRPPPSPSTPGGMSLDWIKDRIIITESIPVSRRAAGHKTVRTMHDFIKRFGGATDKSVFLERLLLKSVTNVNQCMLTSSEIADGSFCVFWRCEPTTESGDAAKFFPIFKSPSENVAQEVANFLNAEILRRKSLR